MVDAPQKRVVCFSPYPVDGPSVRHRIWAYRNLWADEGIDLTLWSFMTDRLYTIRRRFGWWSTVEKAAQFLFCTLRLLVRIARVRGYDGVIIHREVFPLGGAWFDRAIQRRNPNIVYDVDDAIWNPPSQAVNQRKLLWDPSRPAQTMQLSRWVVVGNRHLSAYAKAYNDCVAIVPTTYDDLGETDRSQRNGRLPVVVWIGNLGNAEYLTAILPALEALAAAHPFRLRIIGGEDIAGIRSGQLEIDHCLWTAHREPEWLRDADVGIMPLYDNDYERGKCGFKLVQYFSAGLPVVASPVGVNCDMVHPGVNGFLATTPVEWTEALQTLLSDPAKRLEMGRHARAAYLDHYTREENAQVWHELFNALFSGHSEVCS